jgi:2-polyprenyl-3-methyl-5-hydroxy-6-metoxy-1,4-benzoquinol methylase
MKGWQELWQDPQVRARWEAMPPLPEVVQMADRLRAEGRNRVLDIGCGLGRHTVYLAARGFEVTATDNASAALDACRKNLDELNLDAELLQLDMTAMAFPPGRLHGVVASNVIHHADLSTLERIIGSITEMLAPGGLFVWVTPTPRHFAFGRGREIEPGTWIGSEAADGDLPHHYSTESEVRDLLLAYEILSMEERDYRDDQGTRFHWRVLARKREEL